MQLLLFDHRKLCYYTVYTLISASSVSMNWSSILRAWFSFLNDWLGRKRNHGNKSSSMPSTAEQASLNSLVVALYCIIQGSSWPKRLPNTCKFSVMGKIDNCILVTTLVMGPLHYNIILYKNKCWHPVIILVYIISRYMYLKVKR